MKANLIVGADTGASRTKWVYSYCIDGVGRRVEGFKTSCSMVRDLKKSKYASLLKSADNNSSLIAIDDTYWLVGNAAQGETVSISATQSKHELATVKSLALVGQLMTELIQIGVDEVELTFGILLPIDEWGDRFELEKRLESALWEFEFNGVTVKTALLKGIHISPEGYGISRTIESGTGGVFIFGHRDVTWLHVEEGSISENKSKTFAGMGMNRLIKEVNFTFKDELEAAAILFAAGDSLKDKYLLQIASEADLPRLKDAIADGREQLWLDLTRKFKETTYRLVPDVKCSGGNAYYWQPELQKLLKQRLDLCVELRREMGSRFPKLQGSPLLFRGGDVYRFACTLPGFPVLDLVEV